MEAPMKVYQQVFFITYTTICTLHGPDIRFQGEDCLESNRAIPVPQSLPTEI